MSTEARKDARCGGWVCQKYIERPLLIDGRKFDIRAFCLLVTDRKGRIQAYAHRSCSYVRTSSTKYSLKPQDLAKRGVHFCVEIKLSRRVSATSESWPPRHRRDVSTTAWRCGLSPIDSASIIGCTRPTG